MNKKYHTYFGVLTVYYPNGYVISNMLEVFSGFTIPKCGYKRIRGKEIYINWYDNEESARKAVSKAKAECI